MDEFVYLLNLLRFLVGFSILAFASYTDIKTRRAPNILWVIMGVIGVSFLIADFFVMDLSSQIWYLIFIPIMIVLMYVLFQVRLIFGGADAKALMALAILVPFVPTIYHFPLTVSLMPYSWVIFSNAVVIFLVMPLSLAVYNLAKGNLIFPQCFLGYMMPVEEAKHHFVWPLEKIDNGKRKFLYKPSLMDESEVYAAFQKQGIHKIWVTPKVPFMIPLLAGFITAFFLGDILFILMRLIL